MVRTQRGYVILIFHQYAHHGRGKSIHSCIQLEDNSVQVDSHPSALGGTQSLVTVEGYDVPLDVVNGLLHFNCCPFTDDEWNTLPHVIMTRDVLWSPRQYDSKLSEVEDWYKQQDDPLPLHDGFNHQGEYLHRTVSMSDSAPPSALHIIRTLAASLSNVNETLSANYSEARPRPQDYESHRCTSSTNP